MPCPGVSGTLRNERIALVAPGQAAFGFEVFRCGKDPRIVAGAIKVEQDPLPLPEPNALPVKGFLYHAADHWKERRGPANFLGEGLGHLALAISYPIPPFGVALKRHSGEHDETAYRDDRPKQVQQLDCRNTR